ncbi:MAG: glycosyltransferase [Candidatus Tectomicrobia bacterium]|uniref:Glycosyltransferase n=1 Tax=Tectimicrobiota bacterium TaxID=2528274 RepID=A0A932I3T8_UNCTE|nr:glycosyltransferase [Candidatus Tectomicrobia bacterium]
MKVLFCTNAQSFTPATEPYDFYEGIRSLGHEVEVFFYRRKSFLYSNFRPAWVRWMNRALTGKARGFDLLFVHRGGFIEAGTIERIRRGSQCRCVCFFPDNPFGSTSPGLSFAQIGAYDLFCVKDTYFAEELRLAGFANVEFLPHAYDPPTYERVFREDELAPYRADLGFIGSHYGFRETFFAGLADEGVDFKIWGPGWGRASDPWVRARVMGRGVWGEEKLKVIQASKILLDLQNPGNSVYCCDCKTMSFIGAGAFFVTNHKRDIRLLFEPGEEIVTFRTREELQAIIRRYLADGAARAEIARRGQARARRDHAASVRFRRILEILGERGRPAG